MAVAVKLSGLNDLIASLNRCGGVTPAIIDEACYQAAHVFATAMQAAAPVGTKINVPVGSSKLGYVSLRKVRYPGNLKRSLAVAKASSNKLVGGGALKPVYKAGPNVGAPEGYWLEYGTLKMRARQWARPAIDACEDAAISAAAAGAKRMMDEVK